jgi:hypothetical protein
MNEMEPLSELSLLEVYKNAGVGLRYAAKPAALYFLILTVWGLWSNLSDADASPPDLANPAPLIGHAAVVLVGLAALSWVACGIVRMALDGVRRKPVDWLRFTTPMGDWAQVGIVGLVAAVAIAGGFMLLIVPGIVLALMWSQAYVSILDHTSRWFGALSFSTSLTRGYKGAILLAFAILIIASFAAEIPALLVVKDIYFSLPEAPAAGASAAHLSSGDMAIIAASTILDSAIQTYTLFVGTAIYDTLLQYAQDAHETETAYTGSLKV